MILTWYLADEQLHSFRRRQRCCRNQCFVSIALLNFLSRSLSFLHWSNHLHAEQSLPPINWPTGRSRARVAAAWRDSACLAEAVTALGRAFLHTTNALRHQDCHKQNNFTLVFQLRLPLYSRALPPRRHKSASTLRRCAFKRTPPHTYHNTTTPTHHIIQQLQNHNTT